MRTRVLSLFWESSLWQGSTGFGRMQRNDPIQSYWDSYPCTQPPGYDNCKVPSKVSEFCMHMQIKFLLVLVTLGVISWESRITFPSSSDSSAIKQVSSDFSPLKLIASRA